MVIKGFKFGMLLQLAVGPMCLLVFQTSALKGFWAGFSLVCAVTLIDALFITLSGFGISAVINRGNVKKVIRVFGALVLILFGANMILSAFHFPILPNIQLFSQTNVQSVFFQGILLTASNPLTIVFWSGVFSTQVVEHNYNRAQLFWFGVGCVLSTLLFLTFVAALGTVISNFLNESMMAALNVCAGAVISYFGMKLMLKRPNE